MSTLAARIKAANAALLERGEAGAVGEYFSPDYVAHVTGRDAAGGLDLVRQVVALYQKAFSDITSTVEILAENGDRIAWQRTIRATHRGAFKGFPDTHRPMLWREMITSRFQNGLIVEEWFITDLAEQLLLARKALGEAAGPGNRLAHPDRA